MKKFVSKNKFFLSFVLTVALIMSTYFSIVALAASEDSVLKQGTQSAITSCQTYASQSGWTATVTEVQDNNNAYIADVKFKNSSWSMTVQLKTTLESGNPKTRYYFKGNETTLEGINRTLVKYKVDSPQPDPTVYRKPSEKAQADYATCSALAQKYGWTISYTVVTDNNDTYAADITFKNASWSATFRMTETRQSDTVFNTSFTKNGTAYTIKSIENMLSKYKV